nr:cupin domain-containing protein [uncultured Sphingomonas sp.]
MPKKTVLRLSPLLLLAPLTLGLAAAAVSGRMPPKSIPSNAAEPVRVDQLLRSLATSSGAPIRMPDGPLQIVVSRYHIGPGAALPVHKHPFPRYGHMLSGELLVTNAETGQSRLFRMGDTIVEDVGTWHSARNQQAQPIDLLVIDFVKPGENNVIRKDVTSTPGQQAARQGK